MTMLFVFSWLLFAPVFFVLRWALMAWRAVPTTAHVRAQREPDNLAADLRVALRFIDIACEHAEMARDHRAASTSTSLLLSSVGAGADSLVRSLDVNVATWGEAISALDDAPDVPPTPPERLRSPWLRALAHCEALGRTVLPGAVVRLRLQLFVLRGMLAVLWWEARRLTARRLPGTWSALATLRADLPVVTNDVQRSYSALVRSTDTNAERRCAA